MFVCCCCRDLRSVWRARVFGWKDTAWQWCLCSVDLQVDKLQEAEDTRAAEDQTPEASSVDYGAHHQLFFDHSSSMQTSIRRHAKLVNWFNFYYEMQHQSLSNVLQLRTIQWKPGYDASGLYTIILNALIMQLIRSHEYHLYYIVILILSIKHVIRNAFKLRLQLIMKQ